MSWPGGSRSAGAGLAAVLLLAGCGGDAGSGDVTASGLAPVVDAAGASPDASASVPASIPPVSTPPAADGEPAASAGGTRRFSIPNTTVTFELVRCVGPDGGRSLWVLPHEVTWDLYDVFVYALDHPDAAAATRTAEPDVDAGVPDPIDAAADVDGVSRPSKPYVPPDRGMGHHGYPAMGMTRAAAEAFCVWLSGVTGVGVRLPTRAEFEHLASGDPEAMAWHAGRSDRTTAPVGTLPANGHGLHDMLGNVAEWVVGEGTGTARRPIALGGSYLEPASACLPGSELRQDSTWNASDPQLPKSRWWLADCSWVGFRFVVDSGEDGEPAAMRPPAGGSDGG